MVEPGGLGVDRPLPDRVGIGAAVGLREDGANSHLFSFDVLDLPVWSIFGVDRCRSVSLACRRDSTSARRNPVARGRVGGAVPGTDPHGTDRRAGRVRLGVARRSSAVRPRRRSTGPVGGVDVAGRPGRVDRTGAARPTRGLGRLPRTDDAGQAGGDGRRHLRWAADPRSRLRMERTRVPGLRVSLRSACQPIRRGVHHHPNAAGRRRDRLHRRVLPCRTLRAASTRRSARWTATDGRLGSTADAVDHPPTRRCLERVVERLRQHAGRFRRAQDRGSTNRSCNTVGQPAACRRRAPCSSSCRVGPAAGWARTAEVLSSRSAARRRGGRTDQRRLPRPAPTTCNWSSIRSPAQSIEWFEEVLVALDRPT